MKVADKEQPGILVDEITNHATLAIRGSAVTALTTCLASDSSHHHETNLAAISRCHYPPSPHLPASSAVTSMRAPFATLCLALALAGCRGPGGGPLGQVTIPPPGTQPAGALMADNSYYPGSSNPAAASSFGSPSRGITATSPPATPGAPSFTSNDTAPLADRRGAAISRSSLAAPSRTIAPASREEPIRIPDDSTSAATLAAVVPIRGIPTTDATGLFETVRAQLNTPSFLSARSSSSNGFVEISRLPDAPAELRRAALFGQSLR